jgi:hypothetical protein
VVSSFRHSGVAQTLEKDPLRHVAYRGMIERAPRSFILAMPVIQGTASFANSKRASPRRPVIP